MLEFPGELLVERRHARWQQTQEAKGITLAGCESRAFVEEWLREERLTTTPDDETAGRSVDDRARGRQRGRSHRSSLRSGPTERSTIVGELIGSTTWSRSGLGSSGIDLGEPVRGEVCVTDGPDQSALAVDDRDAFDEGGAKHEVRCLEGRGGVENDRVGRHHVRD
jgi:hypothetical protein